MSEITVVRYNDSFKEKWDDFIFNKSINGTFLQSRIFLEYHKDRFMDHSILFIRGGNMIVGVCPACEQIENGRKSFLSHKGSTFGGIVIGKDFYNLSNVGEIIFSLENYLKQNEFQYVLLKCTNEIFCSENCELIDYFLYKNFYDSYLELSFAIDLKRIKEDVVLNFKSKTRNLFRSSLKNNLQIKEVKTKEGINEFYKILCASLIKYNTKPVHSLEELYDLYFNRLPNTIRFYGVYQNENMIAGSMVFILNSVFHTQYLCANPDYLYLKPMDFMDGSLINISFEEGFDYFSFGISTENQGKYLNETLAKFKEGFGTQFYNNKTYYKEIK